MTDIKTQKPPVKKKAQVKKKTPADINLALVLEAIHEIRETNCAAHEDLRGVFREGLKGVQLNIDANALITHEKLESIDGRFETLNGTVGTLKTESDGRKKAVTDLYKHLENGSHKPWQWVKKNWWAVLLIFIGAVAIIVGLLDYFGLRQLWNIVNEIR
jgi:hypothetical protein